MLEQYRFESDLELAEKQVTWFDVARRERGSRRLDPQAQDGAMRTNSSVCPFCGQPLLPELRVTGRERRRLVDILARRPDGMTRRELADWLYADDPSGGPENTFAVCQLVHQARLQLTAQGYTIISDRGPGAHYRLAKL
jgi:hypothetical protein